MYVCVYGNGDPGGCAEMYAEFLPATKQCARLVCANKRISFIRAGGGETYPIKLCVHTEFYPGNERMQLRVGVGGGGDEDDRRWGSIVLKKRQKLFWTKIRETDGTCREYQISW